MLVFSRQRDEKIVFDFSALSDEDLLALRHTPIPVTVTVVDIRGDKVRLGMVAPRAVRVDRLEVHQAIQRENRSRLTQQESRPDGTKRMPKTA